MYTSKFFASAIFVILLSGSSVAYAGPEISASVDQEHGSEPYRKRVKAYLGNTIPKIVNGIKAVEGQFPWQVSLGVSWIASPADAHFCGGSIFNEHWIVTAAHCVDGVAAEDVLVTAGTIDLNAKGQRRNVARIVVKKEYSTAVKGNDIALLKLMAPLELGEDGIGNIETASTDNQISSADRATVSGFGYEQEDGDVSALLNYVEVPIVPNSICNAPQSYDGAILNDMICAGLAEGGKDSCQGDSGGPLVLYSGSKPLLGGVVSWGEGCARPLKFGVYSNVSVYNEWLSACVSEQETCSFK